MEQPFRNLPGFIRVEIQELPGEVRRKKRDTSSSSSGNLDGFVLLKAIFDAVQIVPTDKDKLSEFQRNIEKALTDVKNNLNGTDYSIDRQAVNVDAFVASVADSCQAQGGQQRCRQEQVCRNSTCFHLCQFQTCSQNGQCYVEIEVTQEPSARCRCQSDGVYDYSGPSCEEQTLQDRWVGAIAGGVAGLVALVLLLAALVYCCSRRRREKLDSSLEDSEDGYNRNYVVPRFTTEYDNASFQKEGGADMYFPEAGARTDPDVMDRFYSNATSEPADKLWVHSSSQPFAIRRPHVDVQPRSESSR